MCKDSTLFIDGVQQENWQFEETLIDSEHSVCTAIQNSPQSPQEVAEAIPNYFQSPQEESIIIANTTSSENNFSLLTCESLLSALQPITKYSSAENQSYVIKSAPWTILWFRILGIFSVEYIKRLCVFMFQTCSNSQLLRRVL